MSITRDNYESWFLDYLEGNLDEKGRNEVRQFVIQHPELADELEAYSPKLQAIVSPSFPRKEQLKKSIYDDSACFEACAIALVEGDMNPSENEQFIKWLENKKDQQEYLSDLARCKLHPDLTDNYPDKSKLKKKIIVLPFWSSAAAVAAILLAFVFVLKPEKKEPQQSPVAMIETVKKSNAENLTSANVVVPRNAVVTTKTVGSFDPKIKTKPVTEQIRLRTHESAPLAGRVADQLALLQPKSSHISSEQALLIDLIPMKVPQPALATTDDISLSDYFKNKLEALKTNSPTEFITREEVALTGLRIFSRLPGHHLTGKKGNNGQLKTITFNTSLLAFSVPVNRGL